MSAPLDLKTWLRHACSVSVGVWTLVAISVERYYAICHPLRSLRWQTVNHAYRLISSIWIGSFICMVPIAILSKLQPTKKGHQKCREDWPSLDYERAYNIFLDVALLLVPLLVLAITYSLITRTLWKGIRRERAFRDHDGSGTMEVYINSKGINTTRWSCQDVSSWRKLRYHSSEYSSCDSGSQKKVTQELRRTNAEKSLLNKKRVIKMLFVVVLEFFICWTPLYVINTVVLFDPRIVYTNIGYTGISCFQLLAYSSSCCNPITYCFMNCGFRKSFLNLFRKMRTRQKTHSPVMQTSEMHIDTKTAGKAAECVSSVLL